MVYSKTNGKINYRDKVYLKSEFRTKFYNNSNNMRMTYKIESLQFRKKSIKKYILHCNKTV